MNDGPSGIGGWLILPTIGLFVFPLRVGVVLAGDYWPLFERGVWSSLTTPGSALYHPLWAPLLLYEVFCNVVFIVFDGALLVLLFKRARRFPAAFIAFALLNFFFVVSDAVAGWQIPAVAARGPEGFAIEIGRSLAVVAIWVPYMLRSKRVRNTFGAGPVKSE
jgi:Protein of unknown function (DUF2569)